MKVASKASCLALLVLAAASQGCTGVPLNVHALRSPELDRKVLILSRASHYKNAIIQHICEELAPDPTVHVKVAGVGDVTPADAAGYDVVVLMEAVWAWRPRRGGRRFVSEMVEGEAADKLIVLVTACDPEFKYAREGVDAVTAVSDRVEARDRAARILAKIRARLNGAGG